MSRIKSQTGRQSLSAATAALVLLQVACSPTYNWRELRPEGAALLATMPCKPDSAERQVPLTEKPVTLHMLSCATGGQTYALAWAKLDSPSESPAALAAWQQASQRSVQADASSASTWSMTVAGADQSVGTKHQGKNHEGKTVSAQMLYFSKGERVYQAAVFGERLPDAALEPFFSGIQLQQ